MSKDGIAGFDLDFAGETLAVISIGRPSLASMLTPTEREVVSLAVEGGLSDDAIALRRACSASTVAKHLASAYRKYKVASRAELAAIIAREAGEAE